MDLNMPRDKETGKPRGFGFLMYEDQRSTVLAVDNLNGAKVLDKTLRVDHVKNYKQPKTKGEDGEWVEAEEQSFNAKPQMISAYLMQFVRFICIDMIVDDGAESDSSVSSGPAIDPEDPMAEYLISKRKEEKALKKSKKSKLSKGKHRDETPEERRARKARKKEKKAKKLLGKSEGMKGVEDLLASLGEGGLDRNISRHTHQRTRSRSRTPQSARSPVRDQGARSRSHHSRSRSRSPRDYEMRGPSRLYQKDDRNYDRLSARDSRSKRGGRDYD